MNTHVEALTTAALSAALEGASRRQAAIAANLANVDTAGYVPLRLSFEAQVRQAQATLADRGVLDPAAIDSLRGELEPLVGPDGSTGQVRVDSEMAELARNAVQFQALVQGLSRHLALQALVAADGRR